MRLGVRVVRRFRSPGDPTQTVEAAHGVELGISPSAGMSLLFPDGAEVTIARVRFRVPASPIGHGVQPVEVELIGCHEPSTRIEAALAAGWTRLEPAAVTAAPS